MKGVLLLFGCIISSTLLFLEKPTIKIVVLLFVALWCAARFYYFMFYVIENYIDKEYKYSGIYSFLKYLYRKKKSR